MRNGNKTPKDETTKSCCTLLLTSNDTKIPKRRGIYSCDLVIIRTDFI